MAMQRIFYKTRGLVTAIVLVLICAYTSACRQPKPLTLEGVGKVKVLGNPPILVDVQLHNPNKYAIDLKHADVDVYLNNVHLGTMRLDTLIVAPARSSFMLPVGMNVDLVSLIPNYGQIIFNPTIHIKLEGSLKAGRKGVFINIPIHYEGDQVPEKIEMNLFNGLK